MDQNITEITNEEQQLNQMTCEKCKRLVDKSNLKRVFGKSNVYECKGNEINNCQKIISDEKQKNRIIKEKERDEENNIKQQIFNDKYLNYIMENKDNFILLPNEYQYRDANTRYYDIEKKIVFKKYIGNKNIWSIDERLSKVDFEYLSN